MLPRVHTEAGVRDCEAPDADREHPHHPSAIPVPPARDTDQCRGDVVDDVEPDGDLHCRVVVVLLVERVGCAEDHQRGRHVRRLEQRHTHEEPPETPAQHRANLKAQRTALLSRRPRSVPIA